MMNDDRIQEIKERVADCGDFNQADIEFLLEELAYSDAVLHAAIAGQETLQCALAEKIARIKELEGGI